MRYSLLIFFTLLLSAWLSECEDRSEGVAPFFVQLNVTSFNNETNKFVDSTCIGSIINSRWILTAAQCVDGDDIRKIKAFVGLNEYGFSLQYSIVQPYYFHKEYSRYSEDGVEFIFNDIVLLMTHDEMLFSRRVAPIQLGDAVPTVGDTVRIYGFGVRNKSLPACAVPKVTENIVINTRECRKSLSREFDVHDKQFCTNPVGGDGDEAVCLGDSGAPAVIGTANARRLVGIISYGYSSNTAYPEVFVSLLPYAKTISKVTGQIPERVLSDLKNLLQTFG